MSLRNRIKTGKQKAALRANIESNTSPGHLVLADGTKVNIDSLRLGKVQDVPEVHSELSRVRADVYFAEPHGFQRVYRPILGAHVDEAGAVRIDHVSPGVAKRLGDIKFSGANLKVVASGNTEHVSILKALGGLLYRWLPIKK
jgi:hypothetical protein